MKTVWEIKDSNFNFEHPEVEHSISMLKIVRHCQIEYADPLV